MKKEVSEKYKLKKVKAGAYHVAGFGLVDLTQISLTEADALYKAKFPFLILRPKASTARK